MSPQVSKFLPAGFGNTRDHAHQGKFAEAKTRHLKLAVYATWTAGEFAAAAKTHYRCIALHFVEASAGVMTLFFRQAHVACTGFERLTLFPIALY